jgi:RNA polymerase sigma-70 factor (ECF subfamily)
MKSSSAEPSRGTSELVSRARIGDREALELLLASVAPSIHRFGRRMCKNAHDADDVLQETLINIANHLGDFEGRSSLSTWAFSLARSACARKRRGLKNQPPVSADEAGTEPDLSPSPEARASDREMATALSTALDAVPDDYREVILLRDVEGLSAAEAASAIGISVDALKSRLHRAREALRNALRPVLEPPTTQGRARCPDVVALWSRKLEGDLDQADCAAMEHHMLGCPDCATACDALHRALLACRDVKAGDVPADTQARVKTAIRAWAREGA